MTTSTQAKAASDASAGAAAIPAARSAIVKFMKRQPAGTACFLVIVAWSLVAIFAPFLAPHPQKEFVGNPFVPPGSQFPLGTDQFGRDVFSRIIWGARVSMYVGVFGAFSGVTIGASIGIIAGYVRGAVDVVVVRMIDGLQSIPALVFALVIVGSFGASLQNVLLGIVIIYIPTSARIARILAQSIGSRPFVEAARSCGAGPFRILALHIVPNVFPPMLVMYSLAVGGAIVVEATLSFLGVGIPADVASWGGMIQASGIQTLASSWWIMLAPGAAIASAVYSFNLFGDALRDQLDPRLRV